MRYLLLVFALIYGGLYLQVYWHWFIFPIPMLICSYGAFFFLFLDYHRKNNYHKAVIGCAMLFILGCAVYLCVLNGLGMILAGIIPFVLFGGLFLKNRR